MNVLWITNTLLPEAKGLLTGINVHKGKGEGWLISSASELVKCDEITLAVASVSKEVKALTKLKGVKITYYVLPFIKDDATYDVCYEECWKKVKEEFRPDVVHLHGTEYPHGLAYLNVCGNGSVVASIQGMTSVIAHYYLSGLDRKEICKNRTFHDFVKRTSLFKEEKKMFVRGEIEKEIISKLRYVIGRTSWDKENVWAINPKAEYLFCNETLREEFYTGKWEYEKCNKHTIFVPQANYPIKGFHQVLKALPLILRHYPDTKVRVAGNVGLLGTNLESKLKERTYNKLLRRIIEDNDLWKVIEFTGPLTAEQMKAEYLKANLFLCPSAIENSPNSLGEAQMLGVPCLSSYVGGVMDMMPNEKCGLMFRFEEAGMLAAKVCEIFESSKDFDNTAMREEAARRHNPQTNFKRTLEIYNYIVKECSNGKNK